MTVLGGMMGNRPVDGGVNIIFVPIVRTSRNTGLNQGVGGG